MVELINHTYFEAEINSGINHYIKGKGEGKGFIYHLYCSTLKALRYGS